MIMIENLQTTIYNSGILKKMASKSRFGTPEKQAPASGKQVIVIIDEADRKTNPQSQEK
jgi:hypothetical protein